MGYQKIYLRYRPQLSTDSFCCFSEEYQFTHITSNPYHQRGDEEAECTVGTIKNLLQKAEDPYLAVLAYCSTPLHNGYSPSELLMNPKLRATVPITCHLRKPTIPDHQHLTKVEQSLKQARKRSIDHKIQELSTLLSGDLVWRPDRQGGGRIESLK